jgi:hypothetical protein
VNVTWVTVPFVAPTTGCSSAPQFLARVNPRTVTTVRAASSMARKMPVITAFSLIFRIAIAAAASITTAPMTFMLTFTTTPR